jgi:hypothetical protein
LDEKLASVPVEKETTEMLASLGMVDLSSPASSSRQLMASVPAYGRDRV